MWPPTHTHTHTKNPFNLIFDKIIKFIDDVTNLNNFGKLSLDKHFRQGYSWISLKTFIFVFSFVLLVARFIHGALLFVVNFIVHRRQTAPSII